VPVAGYKRGTTLQGLLFPATYDVLPNVTPRQFIGLQLAAFQANLAQVDLKRAARRTSRLRRRHDRLFDRARSARPGDQAKIAAVIWNRLKTA